MSTLRGKVAQVTGGAGGLGTAICRMLVAEGAKAVVADVRGEQAEQVVTALLTKHPAQPLVGSAEPLALDVTLPVEEIAVSEWDRILEVNLRGPFMLSRLAFPTMRRQGAGQIVNIVSTAAKRAWANASAYHASKWGLLGLSHALHVEGRAVGIGVTAIIAGGMRTPFLFDRFPDLDPELLQDPSSVANTVRFVLTQPAGTVVPEITVLPFRETSWP